MAKARKRRESFGSIRQRASGRYQASYLDPSGALDEKGRPLRHYAPATFSAIVDARAWLSMRQAEIIGDSWKPPQRRSPVLFGPYAREHVETRTNSRGQPLKPRTRREYLRLLGGPLAEFADVPIQSIKPPAVRKWNKEQLDTGAKTQTARAYLLLKSVLATAVADGIITENPCQIRGAVKASTGKQVAPPTPAELAIITATIDPRLSLLVEIAAWGGLRWGEITELRRGDVMFQGETTTLAVTRAVTYTKEDGFVVGTPKSIAGIRTVALPATLTPAVRAQLEKIGPSDDALLFPSLRDPERHFNAGSFSQYFKAAKVAAGRPDMPFHALRHFGLTRYAMAGATTKELLLRAGHNDVQTALRYQHEAGRDGALASRMIDPTGDMSDAG